ncbi:MAG: hypothetical protein WAS27_03215 [Candidatus Saccharimonadales bacterium]
MDWAQILVIILSIFLALFLLVGIILTILLIRLTQQIKSVTESAKRTANEIEGVVHTMSALSTPSLVLGTIMKHAKNLKRKGGK